MKNGGVMRATAIGIAICACSLPAIARAQSFPLENAWLPLRCHNGIMTDPVGDVSNCVADCDVVGQGNDAAGYRFADDQYVYLRLRVDGDPQTAGAWHQRAWGWEIDTDRNNSTYEILITVSGIDNQVAVYRNSSVSITDSPADPADSPPVATFSIAQNARSVVAATQFGGNADYYVDVAIPWSTLQGLGFGQNTSVAVWAGTSTASDSLNQDIACTNGPGSLSGSVGDPTGFGGTGGTGGAGAGGVGGGPIPDNAVFEGGPNCSSTTGRASASGGMLLLLAVSAGMVMRRCRRRITRRNSRD
jgi:hypothetical protein